MNFSYPPDTETYGDVSGGKKCSFFGKFGVFCFLATLVLRFGFCLITDYFLHKLEKQLNDSYDNQNIDLKTDWYFRLIHLQDLLFEFKTIC